MPYTPTSWVSGTTPVDAPEMNNLETQYTEAVNTFGTDLVSAYVQSGGVATKDGSVATQLDVTTCVAYLTQADGTFRRRSATGTNFSTSGHPSTTMYLFLQSSGSFVFQTSSSGPANSLAIAHCTTDGSSNILVVTDDRVLNTMLLPNIAGWCTLPTLRNGANTDAAVMTGSSFPTVAPPGSIFVKA